MNGLIKGKEVHFDDTYLHVKLDDGRIISTPIDWYEPLKKATLSELKNYRLICKNTGIEWDDLNYHLNIESMLKFLRKKLHKQPKNMPVWLFFSLYTKFGALLTSSK